MHEYAIGSPPLDYYLESNPFNKHKEVPMLKKLPISIVLLMVFNIPLAAQSTHIEFSYQSLRPFVHFQLNFHSYGYDYDAYERTYLKGYMDGVNNEYYFGHHFIDMVRNINAYRQGYRDGFRDRQLLIRLRGRAWYTRHRFAYDDYYAPVYAVRIWLDGLSLAFLKAPAHRLPKRWRHRAHPHLIKYRKWMTYNRKKGNHFSRSTDIERRFKKRIRGHRRKMNKVKKRRRQNTSYNRDRSNRKHYGNKRGFKKRHDIDRDRDRRHRKRSVDEDKNRRRKAVRKNKKRKRKREKVRKRSRDNNKSKRSSRNRSRNRDG